MLLIVCLNLRKDQLQGKPGKYFLARGPVRLEVPRAPMQVKTALPDTLLMRRTDGTCLANSSPCHGRRYRRYTSLPVCRCYLTVLINNCN